MTLDTITMNKYNMAQLEDLRQEAAHHQEEDRLVSRWNSQQTPAFPLPLGLLSPKYPKRQVSAGLKVSSPDRLSDEMEWTQDAPPIPFPCSLGPISDTSFPPKIPMRKSSNGKALADSIHGSAQLVLPAQIPSFSRPLKAASHPPMSPIRLHATTRSRQQYRDHRGASLSPTRRVDSNHAA
jgi:hypothetical protein